MLSRGQKKPLVSGSLSYTEKDVSYEPLLCPCINIILTFILSSYPNQVNRVLMALFKAIFGEIVGLQLVLLRGLGIRVGDGKDDREIA